MIRDYAPETRETVTYYNLCFYDHPDGGYSFPCDKNGNVDVKKLPDAAKANYLRALNNPEKYPYAWKELEAYTRTVKHPATGRCVCGKKINLTNDYLGACECPKCHRWWNVFGEELKNVRYWKNGDDW